MLNPNKHDSPLVIPSSAKWKRGSQMFCDHHIEPEIKVINTYETDDKSDK